ncbi:MAG: metal ABC transporter permease [Planctomycetota bacterium]
METLNLLGGSGGMHLWAIATAAVVAAGCAVVGTLLVVRRMSLLGDAISHAVLPGIVVAVLLGGRPGGLLVLVGAVVAALLTVWLTQLLHEGVGMSEDAGAGVVFTTLFALGVVLITLAASRIDLDPSCVLYGILELVPFDTLLLGGVEVPRAFLTAGLVFLCLLGGVTLLWKEFLSSAFDPAAAAAAGLPVAGLTMGLLGATALATVAGFEAVGAILVVAMLVVPAAAAELLVQRLHLVMGLAIALGVLGGIVGYLAAWRFNTSAAGMIAVVLGMEYALAVLLAPGHGILARAWAAAGLAWRVACEDRLAVQWRAEEGGGRAADAAGLFPWLVCLWLRVSGRIAADGRLLPLGKTEAMLIVRSHRLWEAWLGRHVALPLDHLHPPAEWIEHHLGSEVRRRIAADVGQPAGDPHGRTIPPEG